MNTLKMLRLLKTRRLFQLNSHLFASLSTKPEVDVVENNKLIEMPKHEVKVPVKSQFMISESFISEVNDSLDLKNIKKVDLERRISDMIKRRDNPYELFYLIQKHASDFGPANLLASLKKLAYLKRELRAASRDEPELRNVDLIVPSEISKSFNKLIVKLSPHFEPIESFQSFRALKMLDRNLNDVSVIALMKILKYQVNQLELFELVSLKKMLIYLRALKYEPTKLSIEFYNDLNRALDLAVNLALMKLDNYRRSSETDRLFIDLLNYFGSTMNVKILESLLRFIATSQSIKTLSIEQLANYLNLMDEKVIVDCRFVVKRFFSQIESQLLGAKFDELDNDPDLSMRVLNLMKKLIYFNRLLIDSLLQHHLKFIKSQFDQLESFKDETEKEKLMNRLNQLIDLCIFFKQTNSDMLDLVNESYFKTDSVNSNLTKCFDEHFDFSKFRDYVENTAKDDRIDKQKFAELKQKVSNRV